MAKRESKFIRDFKQEFAKKCRKQTLERKRDELQKVLQKGKVETYSDIFGLFAGLTRKAIEIAAYEKIRRLASLGYDPKEILKLMNPEKTKKVCHGAINTENLAKK
jgi:alkylated DNA nucleotide flippase Atl1